MMYVRRHFQDIVELMASCEALGLEYMIQKENMTTHKWFGTPIQHTEYRLQLVQYAEEVNPLGEPEEA